MNTTGTILLVGGVGLAVFLYMRSQQQQQIAVAAAAAAPAPGSGAPAAGGGISGLGSRLFNQWKQDPLGIANTKAIIGTGTGVVKTAAKQVASVATDIVGGLRSIF